MNSNSNWWNYIVPANADAISAVNMTLLLPLFDKWVKQASNSDSFHEKDNRTPEQEELIRLRKENQQLRMENDILKTSGADIRTKVTVIAANAGRYPVSAQCRILGVPRSTYYHMLANPPAPPRPIP